MKVENDKRYKMEILKPNTGKKIQYIISSNVYVKVWDYGKKYLLVQIALPNNQNPNRKIWTWLELSKGSITDITEVSYSSFDEAINKAINNPYCTVYDFESYEEMACNWTNIKYHETITTQYKGSEKK